MSLMRRSFPEMEESHSPGFFRSSPPSMQSAYAGASYHHHHYHHLQPAASAAATPYTPQYRSSSASLSHSPRSRSDSLESTTAGSSSSTSLQFRPQPAPSPAPAPQSPVYRHDTSSRLFMPPLSSSPSSSELYTGSRSLCNPKINMSIPALTDFAAQRRSSTDDDMLRQLSCKV